MTDVSTALREGLTPSFRAAVGRAREASENKNKAPGLLMNGPVFRETLLEAIVTTLTPVVEKMLIEAVIDKTREENREFFAALHLDVAVAEWRARAEQTERRLSEIRKSIEREKEAHEHRHQGGERKFTATEVLALLDTSAGPGEK